MADIPYQVVFMTAANAEEAEHIAETLVAEGLAACVNMLGSCRSIYKWKGEIVKDAEVLMMAKTHAAKFADIERRVTELHSYDVPEVIAVDLARVAPGYREFLEGLLGK